VGLGLGFKKAYDICLAKAGNVKQTWEKIDGG